MSHKLQKAILHNNIAFIIYSATLFAYFYGRILHKDSCIYNSPLKYLM